MWFTILLSSPNSRNEDDASPLSLLVGSDGHIYLRATDVFKLFNLRRDPWNMCRRFAPTAGRTVQMVLRRGIPTPYPHMKIFTFAEAVSILKKVPGGGVAVADYLVRVFIQEEGVRVKLTERKHQYARRELYYCSNPTRAAVYRIVSNDDDDETISMTELMEMARTKFLEFYRRLQPITKPHSFDRCNDQEEEENDNSLVIVTDEEELRCMSQKQQQQQKPKPTTNDVIQIHFPTVPKEIVWSDVKATYIFHCVKFCQNDEKVTLNRVENAHSVSV